MDFYELVNEMKEFFGVTSLEKVAKELGFKSSVATTWRGRKAFSKVAILKYNQLRLESSNSLSVQTTKPKRTIAYYPHIIASAGYGSLNHDEERIDIDASLLNVINIPASFEKLEMIRIQGDSMLPYVQNGDFAIIHRTPEAKNGDIVIINYQGDLFIKQLQKNPQTQTLSFISSNKEYPSFEIKGDEVASLTIIGILKAVIRPF